MLLILLLQVLRNPDAFAPGGGGGGSNSKAYWISAPVPAHRGLSALLTAKLAEAVGEESVVQGMNATCDSFYSSQVHQDIRTTYKDPQQAVHS